jgi:hypothetical protein
MRQQTNQLPVTTMKTTEMLMLMLMMLMTMMMMMKMTMMMMMMRQTVVKINERMVDHVEAKKDGLEI